VSELIEFVKCEIKAEVGVQMATQMLHLNLVETYAKSELEPHDV
jgi:hypothetical protein